MNTNKYATLEYVDYTKNPQIKSDLLPPPWLDQFLVFCSKTNIEGYEQYIALVSVPPFTRESLIIGVRLKVANSIQLKWKIARNRMLFPQWTTVTKS